MNNTEDPRIVISLSPKAALFAASSVYAYASSSELSGVKGIFQAAMIGGGTTASTWAGYAVGGIMGSVVMKERHQRDLYAGITSNIDRGVTMWALTSALLAAPSGYAISKHIMVGETELPAANISAEEEKAAAPQIPAYIVDPIEP